MMGSDDNVGFDPPPPPPLPIEPLETLTISDNHESNYQTPSSSSFTEPPSYSDSVFCSSSSSSSSRTQDRSRNSDYVAISVTDPRKDHDNTPIGTSSFVTYLIVSKTRDSSQFSVRRRFRDFVTLADRLADSHRGLFVPTRPDKNTVESQVMQQHEFVEQRRLQLEKYLWRLAIHPVVGKCEELRIFLTVEGKLPFVGTTDVASRMLDGAVRLPRQLMTGEGSVPAAEEVAAPAKGGRDLLRIFKEFRQTVTNEWGGTRPAVVEEDREFLERKERVAELEQKLSTTSLQAEVLVKAHQDMEETMGQLGLAFIKLVKLENDEAIYSSQKTRAADAKLVATAAVKASRLYRELNCQTVKHLDTLHEYLGLMLAVRSAFSDRSNALLTVQTLVSDLSSLHAKAEKLEVASSKIFGGDESRIRKLEETRKTIRATEDAKTRAIREYERIKENNMCELERLDMERHDDFLGMLKGFVMNQVAYTEKLATVWATVAEETRQYARETV